MTAHVETIPALFQARVRMSVSRVALRQFDPASNEAGNPLTWGAWYDAARDVAGALIAWRIERRATVAILAANRLLWPIADLGSAFAGLASAGMHTTSTESQLRSLLTDCGARVLIVDSLEQLAKARAAVAGLATRPTLVSLHDDGAGDVLAWNDWLEAGRKARQSRTVADELALRANVTTPDDVAMLIYTSGSTGMARGARLSHRCVVESARSIRDVLGLTSADSSLSFLPFSHAAERIFGLYTRIACGMEATLVANPGRVWEAARASEPTIFGGLPRFFEKVHGGLMAARRDLSIDAKAAWDHAEALGRERAAYRRVGAPVPPDLEAAWDLERRPIARVLAGFFGGRLRLATSGGAVLPIETAEYLDACGLTVLGAYGLTEHLCLTFNRADRYRHDSVGHPMRGTTLRIAADGEVQVRRSALSFSGYHDRPDETARAFTPDGLWLRTGDLGAIDRDGFLRLTGRRKEIIALSNGRKVAPLPIEARLCEGPLISQAALHGEGRPYITALLTLRPAPLDRFRWDHNLPLPPGELIQHPALLEIVRAEVERVNSDLARPEQVRRFVILPHELTVEEGELTPTLTIQRDTVRARYGPLLDALYEVTET